MRSHEPVCSHCGGRHHATNRVEQTSVTRGPGHYPLWVALLCEDCAEKLRDHAEGEKNTGAGAQVHAPLAASTPTTAPVPASPPPAPAQAGWTENDTVRALTAAMREADEAFERVGGSTRHHVRDCLLPVLERHGIAVVPITLIEGEPDVS